jgi:aminotransferase
MSEAALYRKKSQHLADLPGVGIRTKLLEIAATLDDVVAMGRGDPDLDTPQHIIDAGKQALDSGKTHYTHVRGTIELRTAIAEKLKRDNNVNYDPENEIMVTVGAEMAMFMACYAIINPGDEVIVPTPRYTSYDEAITMWGGKVVPAKVTPEDDFAYKPEEIRKCITPRTKAISIVNPGNPIGLIDADVVREIAKIAVEHDLIVISDEIYENIIFDGTKHLSVAAIPGMKERTITLNGPSKSYAMTGWRVGFLAAPAPICEMLTEPSHTVAICCPAVSQAAALAAYAGPQDCVLQMRAIYNERRLLMSKALDEMGLKYVKPRAGFYLFTDVSSLGMTPDEFCMRLLKEEKVLIFPGALFADPTNRFVRISMLSPTERIKVAAERMKRFVKKIKS